MKHSTVGERICRILQFFEIVIANNIRKGLQLGCIGSANGAFSGPVRYGLNLVMHFFLS